VATPGALAEWDGTSGMLALIYVFAIWCVATVLYGIVNEHEPNPRLAFSAQVPHPRSKTLSGFRKRQLCDVEAKFISLKPLKLPELAA
jgi:hypothetical protein